MTLAIILRLRILSLAVIFNYCDFSEDESNMWTQICGKISLPASAFPFQFCGPVLVNYMICKNYLAAGTITYPLCKEQAFHLNRPWNHSALLQQFLEHVLQTLKNKYKYLVLTQLIKLLDPRLSINLKYHCVSMQHLQELIKLVKTCTMTTTTKLYFKNLT